MPLRLDTLQFDELTADPVAPIDGEIWFNTTANELRCCVNGVTAMMVAKQKAGRVAAGSFSGDPLIAAVLFTSAFATTDYGIQLTALTDGTGSFTPNAITKATTGFTIDLGTALSTGLIEVAWMAMVDGENA